MKTSRLFTSLLFAVVCTFGALGSTVTGVQGKPDTQRFRWKDGPIKIVFSTSLIKASANIKPDSDVVGAIRRSAQAWQKVADIEFQIDSSDRQSVSPAGTSGDGVSLITIAQTPENILFFAKDAQTVSAKTRVFYNRKGFITEADIVLNPFQEFSTDGSFGTFDLQSALTHEMGHLLGLHHSAVMGSVMSESLAKNASLAAGDFAPRALTESDVAAVRDLYGVDKDTDDCCAAIAGKLTVSTGKTAKSIKVWAEEYETGRVVGQADTATDGSYKIGGLLVGKYNLYWKAKAVPGSSSVGELGQIELDKPQTKTSNQKIAVNPADFSMDYMGVGGQLTDSAVAIRGGNEQTIYVGGKGFDPANLTFELSSPFLHMAADSIAEQDFGDGVTVLSFVIAADKDAPKGVYSIFATSAKGMKAALIGAVRID